MAAGRTHQVVDGSEVDLIAEMTRDMLEAADNLEFERAAYLRDQIAKLKGEKTPAKGRGRRGKRR